MALPFLPHEHIKPMFNSLKDLTTSLPLQNLVQYVQTTWIDSALWSPNRWSIFQHSVHTNNDVQGWHRRLNHHARRAKLPMYLLINLLHQESTTPVVGWRYDLWSESVQILERIYSRWKEQSAVAACLFPFEWALLTLEHLNIEFCTQGHSICACYTIVTILITAVYYCIYHQKIISFVKNF